MVPRGPALGARRSALGPWDSGRWDLGPRRRARLLPRPFSNSRKSLMEESIVEEVAYLRRRRRAVPAKEDCVAKINSYRDLDVWQVAMELVVDTYLILKRLPMDERFGLTSQGRRCAVSIPSNVAEGHNRHADRVYLNHVNIALGSLAELETDLEIAVRLKYLAPGDVAPLLAKADRVGRMLRRLQQSLEASARRAGAAQALLGVVAGVALLLA
jgi:four helix bundle protein